MEFSSLRAFVQVAREGSFSLAADALFLTQPAISKRIAGLENELSIKLFDRVGRQIFLTEAGRQLLPRAEQIIQEMADIRRGLLNLSGRISGRLSMGTSHHVGLHRLPPALRRFCDVYPQVELDIHFMESERACQSVEHGELELAVVTLPLNPVETLFTERVWHDPLCVAVGLDHKLAQQKNIPLAELVKYPAVLPSRGTYTRALLEQSIHNHRHQVNCTLATDYLETLKMMTNIGLGWSLLPEILLDEQIVKLEVPELKLTRSLGIVMHARRTLSNAASAMRNQLLNLR
ncbi:MAG: LysR family transcriptional regulator [Candidatus Thiodiazotropha sp.]|jgi:DNA-binding transcriptional LysR family regulator